MLISLDTETTGTDFYHGAKPYLVTLCNEDGENTFWEWSVDPLTREPYIPSVDIDRIAEIIDSADIIVGQNIKFDFTALSRIIPGLSAIWDWSKIRCTLTCSHVLASNQPHDLTALALHYLGIDIEPLEKKLIEACRSARSIARREFPNWRIAKDGDPTIPSAKDESVKFDTWLPRAICQHMTDDDPRYEEWMTVCSDYANGDSSVTLFLYQKMEELLKERGLFEIAMEKHKVLPILCRMEEKGITFSQTRLNEFDSKLADEVFEREAICYDIADNYGFELTLPKSGMNKQLKSFMLDKLKVPVLKKSDKTGEPSFDKTVMPQYLDLFPSESDPHIFIKSLMEKRKRDTARTYMKGYQKYALPTPIRWKSEIDEKAQYDIEESTQEWKLLHPSINPNGSDTLRTSSQHPNEQNIGKQGAKQAWEGDEGLSLRYIFGPLPGRMWYSIDYENLELKIPAYEAGEQVMIDLFEKPDEAPFFGSYHLLNASIVYPDLFWPVADIKGEFKRLYNATWYQWIKNTGFAYQYGAQEETVDRTAHKKGAFNLIKQGYPKIAVLNQRCIDSANKLGYVETIPDSEICPERGYPLLCRRSSWGSISPTLPLNYHVQGTACWIMLRAMIKVQEWIDRNQLSDKIQIIMNIHDELVFDFPADNKMNPIRINRIKSIMESVGKCVGIPTTCSVTPHTETWSD